MARLENFAEDDVREAYRLQKDTDQNDSLFHSPRDGQELSASFARLPENFARPWEAVVITPTDDFIGQLKATNQQIILIIIALSIAELFLIYLLSRRLSQPIENISQELKSVESLSFEQPVNRPSKVREIAQLQSAASLLRNSLQSFSSFAPVDVVRGLAELTWAASKCFEAGDLEGSARRYLEILEHFPNDGVATSMLSSCPRRRHQWLSAS